MSDLAKLTKELKALTNRPQAAILQRFFKTGKGQYGEGDVFLGIMVPDSRRIARKYFFLSFSDISQLLKNKIN